MKRIYSLLLIAAIFFAVSYAGPLKPYILGTTVSLDPASAAEALKPALEKEGFSILGEYAPASDPDRWVIVIGSDELTAAAGKLGGLSGFAAVLRIGLTRESTGTDISYTDPIYLGNAYNRKSYSKVQAAFESANLKLISAVSVMGKFTGKPFGSEDGISDKKLQKYHYMFGMEYFDDVVVLNSFSSYEEAVKVIDANLKVGVPNTDLVYSLEIPGEDLKLYGIALSGESGEEHFLPIIDIAAPRHTAFLPYEILVNGNDVVMMHGRFRIAQSFPDLTMMTFGKIMSTPGDIEDLLKTVTQ